MDFMIKNEKLYKMDLMSNEEGKIIIIMEGFKFRNHKLLIDNIQR
jgi:hypothetical protein